ncbi:MAG TPA: DUF1573 domain-containing protein, partial [Desulfobacterales bacterium]|nr:DUF1573 domain-containing protein [Desulfobacterales bacterium]
MIMSENQRFDPFMVFGGVVLACVAIIALLGFIMNAGQGQSVPEKVADSQSSAARGDQHQPERPFFMRSRNTDGPVLEFDEPVYDFGKVMAGVYVDHSFRFRNAGKKTLRIISVNMSCGCTTAGKWPRKLEPGQEGELPVKLDTKGFSGAISKSIDVESNDPLHPVVTLKLNGNVWKPIVVKHVGGMGIIPDLTKPYERSVRLSNRLNKPIKILGITPSDPGFKTSLKTLKDGYEYLVTITISPPYKTGGFSGKLEIKTSAKEVPSLKVNLYYFAPPPVEVRPASIVLFALPTKEEFESTVWISNHTGRPIEVTDVSINDAAIKLKAFEDRPGKEFRITLTFPKGYDLPKE